MLTATFEQTDVELMTDETDEKYKATTGEWADQIKARRIELGMSQADLAERTGITKNHISKIERKERKVGLASLFDFSDALGLSFNIEALNGNTDLQADPSGDEHPTDYDTAAPS